MKMLLMLVMILLAFVGNVSAIDNIYASDGLGTYSRSGPSVYSQFFIYDDIPETLYFVAVVTNDNMDCSRFRQMRVSPSAYCGFYICARGSSLVHNTCYPGYNTQMQISSDYSHCASGDTTMTITLYNHTPNTYTVSGTTLCVTTVELYTKLTNGNYALTSTNRSEDCYEFDTLEDQEYKLVFDGGHEYFFTADSNNIYNYNACCYYTLNLVDDCANMLINPHTSIYHNNFYHTPIYNGSDNPILLHITDDISLGDNILIMVYTCDGNVLFSDSYVEERERTLVHRDISWDITIHVVDDTTDTNINLAKVTRAQTCCIIGDSLGYALTQTTGKVCFIGLSNSNIDITVEKDGYKDYSTTLNIGSCFNCQSEGAIFKVYMNASSEGGDSTDDFNNGTHNDSENTDGATEEILPSEHGFGCGVYFKNTDGNIVDTIYDTDTHVDMYWWVKNHDGGDSNLKFQHQTYTYWYDTQSYTVSNNTYEYRRIYNTDFLDHTDSYRGYIYNTTEGCNDIQILRVINKTYEEESHYENLSAHCSFRHKLNGDQIDYRSNVEIMICANSSNATLLNITAHFMNGSTFVDLKNLNWADFSTGRYVWEPNYEYTSGYNYTINITGFDDYQLDTDTVWTSDIIGSTLTVNVKDNYGAAVTGSTVFIEDWGSIATGSQSYASVSGLSQGAHQYKATKSGYISSGWASVTLDNDESVTCVLVSETQTSITASKMTNAEIKAFFIPLMYLLLIMMLLGAFRFACGGK